MPVNHRVEWYQNNILKFAQNPTTAERIEGMSWYFNAHLECKKLAKKHNLTDEQVAAIVAAISPMTFWERNIEYAEQVITTGYAPCFAQNVIKAIRIRNGEDPMTILGGDKVLAFYRLLRDGGNKQDVTIDSIAILIALGKKPGMSMNKDAGQIFKRNKIKSKINNAYTGTAAQLGIRPCDFQALTWVMWRNRR